jgi:cardiolipin synthase
MNTPGHKPPRVDFAVRVEGPAVGPIVQTMSRVWALCELVQFSSSDVSLFPDLQPMERAGSQTAKLAIRDNLRHRRDIELAYLECIGAAREDIIIACAYFFPGRRFRLALAAAARRGVRVNLLLQGKVEYALLHYASRALYGRLLGAGVRIYEYHRSFLHAKVAVFDDDAACVGSSNIDPMSLLLAREANVFVRDRRFAAELRQSLQLATHEGARRVPLRTWRRMPVIKRLAIWAGYRMARLLMAVYGYGREH